ncbi:MAG: DMT family transporter [Lysobacteraceae bacterium]|uniref:DMT family transporter n=1 Tax=Denitratimonas sp. CY0512 TaxID=3131940 RepID=UPI0030A1B732
MPRLHLLLILTICVVWAINFLTSAISLRELPPLLFAALRLLPLILLLLPWMRWPTCAQWPRLAVVALCNGALHFGLNFWALKEAGNLASPAIVLQSYIPMTTVLAVLFLREKIGWRTWTGVSVSFAGVLVLGFDPIVLDAPFALMLMLLSAFSLAVGTVTMRGLTGMHPIGMQGWVALIAVGPLLAWSLLSEQNHWLAITQASPMAWLGVAWAALAASVLGHSLFYWLVQRHPVSTLTPYLLLTPVFAVALGIAFWGDRPGPRLYIGGAMVLGGVFFIALRARTRARKLPEPAEI